MSIDISRLGPAAQRQIAQKLKAQNIKIQKDNKYHSEKEKRWKITFDSRKEARRYDELILMVKAGMICDLRLQPQFTLEESYLTPNGERVRSIIYKADFSYINTANGEMVVEDVKSKATKTRTYEIKRKMMLTKYGISIREV